MTTPMAGAAPQRQTVEETFMILMNNPAYAISFIAVVLLVVAGLAFIAFKVLSRKDSGYPRPPFGKQSITNLKKLLSVASLAFSAERRQLFCTARSNLKSMTMENFNDPNHVAVVNESQVAAVREIAHNLHLLRHVAEQSRKHKPTKTLKVLKCLDSSQIKALGHLTDQHFEAYTHIANHYDTLNWKYDIDFQVNRSKLSNYALANISDYALISYLLNDRDMWNYEEIMETLQTMKLSGHTAFASGAL